MIIMAVDYTKVVVMAFAFQVAMTLVWQLEH